MKVFKHHKLAAPAVLKARLKAMAALDIVLVDEEWLRVYSWRNEDGVDVAQVDNGSGDSLFVIFSADGVVIKGFDHESPLSPYANDEEKLCDGIYDELPQALLAILDQEGLPREDVSFCIWCTDQDTWHKGDVQYKDADKHDGTDFLLGYLHCDAAEWIDWAIDYYEPEEDLPEDIIEKVFDGEKITESMIKAINNERDPAAALHELASTFKI